MADNLYYIDRIKYGKTNNNDNKYLLLDSGATHDSSHNLSGSAGNFKSNGTIAADKGVFNRLIATDAEISNLNVDELNADNLTANNATVVGLLDVQGDLHTNSWTNSNIATIQGNFYIAPTVMTGTSDSDTGVTITAINNGTASTGYWTLAIGGTNILSVPNLEADKAADGEAASSYNSWSSGSTVMVTGSIKKNGIVYPLGTLKGELNGAISSSGATITKITDHLNNNPSTLQEYGAGTYGFVEIKISLYKRKYGNSLYPLGILMSAQGRASKSFIDIYGGAFVAQEGTISGASSDYGGLAMPNVRIGNLRGLPNVRTGDFADNAALPTGWGIYTDNGYFKGTIVSTYGEIGGFSIGSTDLYNNKSSLTHSNAGIYISTTGIAGGAGDNWWIKSDGTFQFGGSSGIRFNGTVLTVPAANVSGTLQASTLQTNVLSALQANLTSSNTKYLSAIYADMGSITAGSISKGYNSINFNNSPATLEFKNSATWANSTQGIKYDSNGLAIKGTVTATSFEAYNNNTLRAKVDLDGLTVYAQDGTTVAANLGKLQDTSNYTATIGRTDGYYISLTSAGGMYFKSSGKTLGQLSASGLQWYTNDTTPQLMAHLGYGNTNLETGTGDRPYYTFGIRTSDSSKGGYSVAEGYNIIASGYVSHAEGSGSRAYGPMSHAEGASTYAYEAYTHAEGLGSSAGVYNSTDGTAAHAEGTYTHAYGNSSHAQNYYTEAAFDYQTVIGKRNNNKSNDAFEIGNGSVGAPSNAFEVDWSGNVNIASGAKYKINGTALTASDVSAIALSDKYTRSSAGTVDWSNQTDGEAKIITKSALAYWNGCYSGTNSNLSRCSQGQIIGRNQICYANSRVDTFSNGQFTIANSSLGVTTGAKPVGILLTPEYGTAVIMKYNYDSSNATNSIIECWNHDGTAYSGAMRYFAVVFQNTWTTT